MFETLRTRLGRILLLCALSVAAAGARSHAAQSDAKPKVRAITAFVRLEPTHYTEQIAEALSVLRDARAELSKRGYQVETVRIVTQPLAELLAGQSDADALAYLKALDALSANDRFALDVGPAMMRDGDDPRFMRLLAVALSSLPHINASALIAGDDGIHWKVIHESAELVHDVAEHSPGGRGDFNFAATAMLKPYGPFFPGAYHDGAGRRLSIGFEGANVVAQVFARTHGDFARSIAELTRQLTIHAKVAESVGRQVAARTGWTFMGVDPTPAPAGGAASIAAAIETYTGARFGSSGTMTAALVITTAVKAVPVQQIGYSGLMLPVLEDPVLAKRWAEGAVHTDELLAYSSVCGTGLDTVPYPGDIGVDQLARIMGDVASLAWKWHKPLTARLQPDIGRRAGEESDFKNLTNTRLQPLP